MVVPIDVRFCVCEVHNGVIEGLEWKTEVNLGCDGETVFMVNTGRGPSIHRCSSQTHR